MTDFYQRTTCRLCEHTDLRKVISLIPTPPGNHFVPQSKKSEHQAAYPLDVYFCRNCAHLQLGVVVDPKILYQQNYSYVSGTSPVFVEYLKNYAYQFVRSYSLRAGSLVVDIGSNDGTALRFFAEQGFKILGVDPATEIAEAANAAGIPTVCAFFDQQHAEQFRQQYGAAQLITSHNTFAHIDHLDSVVSGVRSWLADDGLLAFEVGYLFDVYQKLWFDTIYHEHLDFHSLKPLVQFLDRLDMQVIHAERVSPQGGSLHVIAQKKGGPRPVQSSVGELIEAERAAGLHEETSFLRYADRINEVKRELTVIVRRIKAERQTIAGFGAPTKATTLLSYFELADALDFLVDENPLKQNLYSPGHHIPVYAADAIYQRKPDYVLILAWNFAEDIMRRHHKFAEGGGHFILPMPRPAVVN